jgi:hypothetical protein
MDRGGVEPTPSASFLKPLPTYIYLKAESKKEEFTVQLPSASFFFFDASSIALTFKRSFKKKAGQGSKKRKKCVAGFVYFVWQRGHGLASKIKLNGVWVARRNFEKPADETISAILSSPACAPRAGPFSFKDAGTQTMVDAE